MADRHRIREFQDEFRKEGHNIQEETIGKVLDRVGYRSANKEEVAIRKAETIQIEENVKIIEKVVVIQDEAYKKMWTLLKEAAKNEQVENRKLIEAL